MQTLNAHFDGRFIVLDEPAWLKLNDKVTVIAPDADNDGLADGCARLSEPVFQLSSLRSHLHVGVAQLWIVRQII